MSEHVSVAVTIDGSPAPSHTRVVSAAAEVLMLSTTITSPRAPVTVHSTYVGRRGGETAVTHLVLSPAQADARPEHCRHPAHQLPVAEAERHLCLYDHLQHVLLALRHAGVEASIDVRDQAIGLVDQ